MKILLRLIILVAPLFFAVGVSAQAVPDAVTRPLRIISKPKPAYTDIARRKDLEGHVLLRVTFLASGEIGSITNVTKKKAAKLLKYGLVDKAIEAARKITFEPKMVNGTSISVVALVDYGFTIY
jgi:TonB family protein